LDGGKPRDVLFDVSRFATSSLVPRVEARARCAAASPPERRSHELSGGGCKPVPDPRPASPRLIAGLSSSASAGPIGCTSGRDALEDALELGALDFGVLPGFFGWSGFFAIGRIWDESGAHKRAKARRERAMKRRRHVSTFSAAVTVLAPTTQPGFAPSDGVVAGSKRA
jgi:hypothetical protein